MKQTSSSTTNKDILDALDHMSDFEGKTLDISDFIISKEKEIPLSKIPADFSSWVEFDNGELVDMSESERFAALNKFRPGGFAHRAMSWISKGKVPPVILVELKDGYADIGDGRGRITVAIGMGWKKVPVIKIKQKPDNEKIEFKNNPTYADFFIHSTINMKTGGKIENMSSFAIVSNQEIDCVIMNKSCKNGEFGYPQLNKLYKEKDVKSLSDEFLKIEKIQIKYGEKSKTIYDGSLFKVIRYNDKGVISAATNASDIGIVTKKLTECIFNNRSELMKALDLGARLFTLRGNLDMKNGATAINIEYLCAEDI